MSESITVTTSLEATLNKIDQRLDKIDNRLERIDEKCTNLQVANAEIKGEIKVLDQKVTGLGQRIDNQEYVNRGILTALIVALIAGEAKLFGWLPTT